MNSGLEEARPQKIIQVQREGPTRVCIARGRYSGIWDAVKSLIAEGHNSDTAIDRIYLVHGWGQSNTMIIKIMIPDKRWGLTDCDLLFDRA